MLPRTGSITQLYSAKQRPEMIEVPDRSFLAVDGTGDPQRSVDFQLSVDALLAMADALQLTFQATEDAEVSTPPLEALWWTEEDRVIDLARKTSAWHWRVMIALPDAITKEDVDAARAAAKSEHRNPALSRINMVRYAEGLCVQILHVGPYSKEQATIERLHSYAHKQDRELRGRHHEIYLGDPRQTRPEELRTILRQPIA